ncbi:uncharacterized protein LOC135339563 [Halichondria panicea]|uniref:uncharacterized protein LOC135339563 n=1 Tax=Halichondria panicea TaxID=6063 RepID=UPI00312B2DBB
MSVLLECCAIFTILLCISGSTLIKPLERRLQGCLKEGSTVQYVCQGQVTSTEDTLIWDGGAFQCFGTGSSNTNRITLRLSGNSNDSCGEFTANLTVTSQSFTSILTFTADIGLHDKEIVCRVNTMVCGMDTLKVGGRPKPPLNIILAFPRSDVCIFSWDNNVTEAPVTVDNFYITTIGKCGQCDNEGLVPLSTSRFKCKGWTPDGTTCTFNIQSRSSDCHFRSDPASYTVVLDNTPARITGVSFNCSAPGSLLDPIVRVQWQVDTIIDRDQIDAARRLPDPLNFIISINNLQNQSAATSTTVPYTDRSYEQRLNPGYYNVTVWNRNVVNPNGTSSAEYMINVPTSLFADEIATDSNGYPCIRVAINNSCLQCASSFSGQLAYKNGSCGTNEAFKFSNRTMQFDSNMQACVPFEDILETEVCYYVLVHSIKDNYAQAVAQSIEKPVLLFPCNATKIPLEFNTSVEGFIRHNQLIDLACIDNELMVLNGPNEIRCVNGTFLPSVDNIFCAVENPQCPIMDSYERSGLMIAFLIIGWICALPTFVWIISGVAIGAIDWFRRKK